MLSAFIPIWFLTALGYLTARYGLVGAGTGDAEAILGRFVFRIAMPAALFGMLARTDVRGLANTSIVAFGASAGVTCLVGLALSRLLFKRGLADQAISGMASGYVNSANLGIPVAVQILGSASFVSTVILLQTVVVTPLILTLVDVGTGLERRRSRLRDTLLLPLRNPVIIGSGLGAVVSAAHWRVPGDLSRSINLLGGAAVPVALVVLGMSLHGRSMKPEPATLDEPAAKRGIETTVVIALKILLQPGLAFLAARYALNLPAHDVLAVTLCAALPTAQNVFIYAREYELDTTVPRDAVIFSTLASMASLSVIVALLK